MFYDLRPEDYQKVVTVEETIDDGHNVVVKTSNGITGKYAQILTNQCTLSGDNHPGSVLTVSGGDVVLGGSGSYTYVHKWYRDTLANEIAGERNPAYTTTADDHFHSIFCVKTATDDVTAETFTSSSNSINVHYDPLTSTNPGIFGRLEVGAKLTVIVGQKDGGSGSYNLAYSWLVGGSEVGTGTEYVVDQTDYDAGSIVVREIIEDDNDRGNIIARDSLPLYVDLSVKELGDLDDVSVTGAQTGDVLVKTDMGWGYADPVSLPEALVFAGYKDVSTDSPDGNEAVGTVYIQHKVDINGDIVTPVQFNDQWPDIPELTEMKEGQYLILGTSGKWHKGGQSQQHLQADFAQTDAAAADFIKNKPENVSDFNVDIDYSDVNALRSDISKLENLPGGGTYYVTVVDVNGDNKYALNSVLQSTVTTSVDEAVIFDQSGASNTGHPLRIYDTADKNAEITDGVVIDGDTVTFTPDTTGTFYYQCSAHADMGGEIRVV